MAGKISTGLRNGMLGSTGFKGLMDDFRLRVYAGDIPATADAALGGAVLLAEYTESDDGTTGLTFGTPSGATIAKNTGETWSSTPVANGVGTFFRCEKSGDDGTLSTSALRIQGDVGTLGAIMNVSNATYTIGVPVTLNYFLVNFPTA
jgi:hypothetical protein